MAAVVTAILKEYYGVIIPGDIVLLASGVKVPADLRPIEVNELRVEEVALTGSWSLSGKRLIR